MKNLITIIFLSGLFLPIRIDCAQWTHFMGDEKKTGFIEQTLGGDYSKDWEFDSNGQVIGSAVVYEDILYFSNRAGSVYALDPYSGQLIWDYSTDGFIDATVAVSSNLVVFPSMDGKLYSLNRLTGDIVWVKDMKAPSVSNPLILNGIIYVGISEPVNSVNAYKLENGDLVFSISIGQPVLSAFSTDGYNIFFGANDGKIYSVNALTGNINRSYQFTGGAFGMNSLAYSSGTLYALPGHDERRIFKLKADDFSLMSESYDITHGAIDLWDWQRVSSVIVSTNSVYFLAGSANYYLIGLDKDDLTQVKVSSVSLGSISDSDIIGSPVMAGRNIYLATVDARFMVLSSTGAIIRQINISTGSVSALALYKDRIYFGDNEGRFYSFKSSKSVYFLKPENNEVIYSTYAIKAEINESGSSAYYLEYAPDNGLESYVLLSSGSYDGSFWADRTLYNLNTASLGEGVYYLRLRLSNPDFYSRVKVRVKQKPLPPSNFKAQDNPNDNGNKILLTWSASSTPGVSYNIYRLNSSFWDRIASTTSLSYIDGLAFTSTTYYYKITSFNGYTESDFSAVSSAYSLNDNPLNDFLSPSKVSDLSAIPGAKGGDVSLSWSAPGNDGIIGMANHYQIKYSSIPFDWNTAKLWKSSRPVSGPYLSAENETIKSLLGGVTYYFAVKAFDYALNESPISNYATSYAMTDYLPPAPPSEFLVYDTPGDKGGRLTLQWKLSLDDGANQNDVYGYKIFRSTKAGEYDYQNPYAEVSAGNKGYMDTSAPINVKYFYKLASYDSMNLSFFPAEMFGISANNWRYVDSRNGGSLLSEDGAELFIPPGSLDRNDNMIILKLDPNTLAPLSALKANTAAKSVGIFYEVKFDNPATKILNYAEIKLPYDSVDLSGISQDNLRLYQKVGSSWRIIDGSTVLTSEKKVYARINSLGIYGLMEYIPSGQLISLENIYTYPNPATGETVKFKFLVSDKSSVKISIYNVAGEKVGELKKDNCPAGLTSEIEWNIKNIASGVYVYVMDASSAAGNKTLSKKMAVKK